MSYIRVIMQENTVATLLEHPLLVAIETAITSQLQCSLYREDLPRLIGFMEEEIAICGFTVGDIQQFIETHYEAVIDFGLSLWRNERPEALSTGIAFTYAIYLLYFKHRNKGELVQYIKRRRIPTPRKVVEALHSARERMRVRY